MIFSMDLRNPQIPERFLAGLKEQLGPFEYYEFPDGASKADVFQLVTEKERVFFVKVAGIKDQNNNIDNERKACHWLLRKMPVPKVIHFQKHKKWAAICTPQLLGESLANALDQLPPETAVKIYAQTLKQLHDLPIDDCPLRFSLGDRIALARKWVEKGELYNSEFEPENQRYTPDALFEKLLQLVPHEQHLVFTHGDYCMDNIFVNNGELSGLIDLGRAGIADMYQDIALAIRSIRHELGMEYEALFCQEYGLDNLDQDKVDFYILLDEFF